DKYSLSYPKDWSIVKKDDVLIGNPKNSEIEFISMSKEVEYGFSNNMLILSQDLNKKLTSQEFSIINNVGSTKNYLNYKKLDTKTIEFLDKNTSELYIFEAKYNSKTPIFKYLQIGKVCGMKGYLLTIAISQDIKQINEYEDLVKTFSCK
ncbi:MAG: hypothetical protein NWP80_00370, partial [Candidatus Gracilibacteria bacterium]|nr:hypothetical protein [Candidatus Gracilibacteria bacterium]